MRTADYPEHSRKRLGGAVKSARRAAGFRFRPAFAKEADISKRSLEAVELDDASVGDAILENIGRTLGLYLKDWNEGTPRAILEGDPIPSNDLRATSPEAQQRVIAVYNEEERTFAEALADLDFTVDEIIEHLELRRARNRTQSEMDVGQVGESSA